MTVTDVDSADAAFASATVVSGSPVEIASGVFVIPDRHTPLAPNIGVVVGDRAALVIDTGMGPRNGAIVHEIARDLAGDRPLFLTITHFHPEHGFGAQAFPDATIVYNRAQHEEFQDKGQAYLQMFRGFGSEVAQQLEEVVLVQSHVVYDGAADLDLGGNRVQLRTWGPAHTRGDQVVFLPAERVLFTGDLVENGSFPIFPFFPPHDADVDARAWIGVLEELQRLDPTIVVPGHGDVGDASLIAAAREYLELLQAETTRLAREGLDVDAIIATLEPRLRARYPGWTAPEWIASGVRSVFAQ
jgi:glyoxylase-like metal-dependent hydrolase (beta-lactamase superfamily II)